MAGPLVIPIFREKVVYWKTTGGTDVSYPVSASYKGILRLSPNDDLSLQEQEPISLYDEDIENYYRDSIDPAITQQFIRVATSDGILVGLRFSQYDIEADSLYIIGPAKFDCLRLYSLKSNAFKLSPTTSLPNRANTNTTALIGSDDKILEDVTGVDPHSSIDQSYTLISRNLQERQFTYQQTTQLIRELVVESLLDLKTIPTGSIQFSPISIKKYEEMIIKGRPNSYFLLDNETPNEPVVRDYLICDGSLYSNKDFPELAKILEGERIDYWRYDNEKGRMVQMTHINDYSSQDRDHKWFRVPDLRARFIKSIFMGRDDVALPSNVTGMYSCDARPKKDGNVTDNHVHFITTAFYQSNPQTSRYAQVATVDKKTDTWTLSDNPGVLHPHNRMQQRAAAGYGSWYNTSHYSGGCVWQASYANQAGYFLSIPAEYDYQEPNCTPDVGLSSVDMPSCVLEPSQDSQISYNTRKDFKSYVGTGAVKSYGMENAPEFYCMLPLIKI